MKSDALYCRVSTDQQVEFGESIETQKSRLLEYANQSGYQPKLYVDAGFSAKDTNRPQLKLLRQDIKSGLIRSVSVTKLDRITRSLHDLLELLREFEDYDVTFKSITQPFDTSTATGKLQLQLIGIIAEWERSITSERVSEDMRHMAKNGKWLGGPIPFGYMTYGEKLKKLEEAGHKNPQSTARQICPEDKKLYSDPEEARIIKRIFDLYLETTSIRAVTHRLNNEGYLTRAGEAWSNTSIRRILGSGVYIGSLIYNRRIGNGNGKKKKRGESEWITVSGTHQPLISEATFERVQKTLQKQSKEPIRRNSEYLLSGILYCGKCNGRMHGFSCKNAQGKPFSYYKCMNHSQKGTSVCKGSSVRREKLEEAIIQCIFDMRKNEGFIDAKQALRAYNRQAGSKRHEAVKEKERFEKRKAEVQRRKQSSIERLEDETISREDYKLRAKALDEELLNLDNSLFRLEAQLSEMQLGEVNFESVLQIVNDISGNWKHTTASERKEALATLIKRVIYTSQDDVKVECYSSKSARVTARTPIQEHSHTFQNPFLFILRARVPQNYELLGEPKTLGERIKYERLRQGMTAESLASQLGVCSETVRNWETSNTAPNEDRLNRLKTALPLG